MLIGIAPLPSARTALWMREHLPGSIIPDAIIDRLARAGDPKAEGKRICIELLQELTQIPAVSGAHIMAPRNHSAVAKVAEARSAGSAHPDTAKRRRRSVRMKRLRLRLGWPGGEKPMPVAPCMSRGARAHPRSRKSGSQRTRRWREMDSNPRSLSQRVAFSGSHHAEFVDDHPSSFQIGEHSIRLQRIT